MKTRLYFSLSVLTIVALFLLPAAVEAVPLPDQLGNQLAINHENTNGCRVFGYTPLLTDQRGFSRSGHCDIGAYELQPDPADGPYSLFLPFVKRSCPTRLYFDDFSVPGGDWFEGENEYARYEYLNDEYRILAKEIPVDDTWVGSYPGYKFIDYVLEVDVRNHTGTFGYYGLSFEWKEDWSQYYVFQINTSGEYVIFRADQAGAPWLSHGYSPFIRTGTATNHLKLERNGSQIWAYANGELLVILNEPTTTEPRYVGLFTISTTATVDSRYDNFTVEPISCGASYNYPVLAGDALEGGAVEFAPPEGWESAPHILVTGP